jgi:site-specific DNA recombinase
MNNQPSVRRNLRCAVYTRKSTEEGLEQAFNSLDAQREAAEAYIASQQHEGWRCLPQRYDDGGYTGANMDRPALQRLLADMAAGHIDVAVVYKVDRLSRSLLDFAKIMEAFDKHRIAFVSITQQFSTATSMGRLILNVLLSFAQFEREIISERTRDKIAATRRKGKWSGGTPILGYDVDLRITKLVINEAEAAQVRAIFELYLRRQVLRAVVEELHQRGWVNKRWRTRNGNARGGRPFTKTSLHLLLTNVLYAGKIKHKGAVHPGEQPAIVAEALWQEVQDLLRAHSQNKGSLFRNRFGAVLKGLLHCLPCGCAMTPTHASSGTKRYRYYLCTGALKFGRHSCPAPSIAAAPVEQEVLEQLKALSQDYPPMQALLIQGWPALALGEQARMLRLLIERVDYDGRAGKLVLALCPRGPQRLAEELGLAEEPEEKQHDRADTN